MRSAAMVIAVVLVGCPSDDDEMRDAGLDTGIDSSIDTGGVDTGGTDTGSVDTGGLDAAIVPGPDFRQPEGIMLDLDNNRAIVADSNFTGILSVDLATGARTILSDEDHGMGDAMEEIAWQHPWDILPDGAGSAWVSDNRRDAIISVDLSNGNRTLFSRGDDTRPQRGSGPEIPDPHGMALDSANSRVLVIGGGALFEVDLAGGNRTLLSSFDDLGIGPLQNPVDVAYDPASTRAFIVDMSLPAIVRVDLGTGNRTVFSGCNTLVQDGDGCADTDPIVGEGPDFDRPRRAAFDIAGDRLLVTDQAQAAVFAVDLATGNRTFLSREGFSGEGPPLVIPIGIVVDSTNGRALVTDEDAVIFAVDLASGDRSVISSRMVPPRR